MSKRIQRLCNAYSCQVVGCRTNEGMAYSRGSQTYNSLISLLSWHSLLLALLGSAILDLVRSLAWVFARITQDLAWPKVVAPGEPEAAAGPSNSAPISLLLCPVQMPCCSLGITGIESKGSSRVLAMRELKNDGKIGRRKRKQGSQGGGRT